MAFEAVIWLPVYSFASLNYILLWPHHYNVIHFDVVETRQPMKDCAGKERHAASKPQWIKRLTSYNHDSPIFIVTTNISIFDLNHKFQIPWGQCPRIIMSLVNKRLLDLVDRRLMTKLYLDSCSIAENRWGRQWDKQIREPKMRSMSVIRLWPFLVVKVRPWL